MSKVLTPCDVRAIDGDTWTLVAPYRCLSDRLGLIEVPAGEPTDFNSVPRVFWNILPPTENFTSAIPHDFLYRHGRVNGVAVSRADADSVHQEFLVLAGAPAWKRRVFGAALRSFGWIAWNKYRKQDTPRVFDAQ